MKPATCQEGLDNLKARYEALTAEEQALLLQGTADTPPTPELVAECAQDARRCPVQRHGATEKGIDSQAREGATGDEPR
jgi:hypothetical protein